MPSGDAHRTWFPELVKTLKKEWNPLMSFGELISLRDHLDEILQTIRKDRKNFPPMMWCPKCKRRTPSQPTKVTVRGVILAIQRFKVASEEQVKELDKRWNKYRKVNNLNCYGKKDT